MASNYMTQFMPINPIEDDGAIFDPIAQAAQGQQVVDSAVKERRQEGRSHLLMALGAALSSLASKDPGRVAAQFIEQQMQLRARKEEFERNEELMRQKLRVGQQESILDRAHQTNLQKARQGFEAGQQKERLEAGAEQNQLDRTLRKELQRDDQDFRLTTLEKELGAQLDITNLRLTAEKARQDERLTHEERLMLARDKQKIQREMTFHALALGETDPAEAALSGNRIASFLSGDIGRSELTTNDQSVLASLAEKMALQSSVQTEMDLVQLQAAMVNAATVDQMGQSTFSRDLYDQQLKRLPEDLRQRLTAADPQLESMTVINTVRDKMDRGEELTPQELDQARTAFKVVDPSGESLAEFEQRLGAGPTDAAVGAGERRKTGSLWEAFVDSGAPDAIVGKAQEMGQQYRENIGKGVDQYRANVGRAASGVGEIIDQGVDQYKANVGRAARTAGELFRTPEITPDTPVWDGKYADTPVGYIVQHPDSGDYMFRGPNVFHRVNPERLNF